MIIAVILAFAFTFLGILNGSSILLYFGGAFAGIVLGLLLNHKKR